MVTTHTLLLKCEGCKHTVVDARVLGALATDIAAPVRAAHARVGIETGVLYATFELAQPREIGPAIIDDLARRAQSAFAAPGTRGIRLERKFDCPGASAGRAAPFYYVVETNGAPGEFDEIARWYDTEHMPGLASVPGCAQARRYLND